MSVVIKGSEPFDVMIVSNIVNCRTANIKFKNISFRCETIEDADGTVFVKMPSTQPEPLTDKEQRIFLSAMSREEEVCKQVDDEWRGCREPYEDSLVRVCHEITRKVKGALWGI